MLVSALFVPAACTAICKMTEIWYEGIDGIRVFFNFLCMNLKLQKFLLCLQRMKLGYKTFAGRNVIWAPQGLRVILARTTSGGSNYSKEGATHSYLCPRKQTVLLLLIIITLDSNERIKTQQNNMNNHAGMQAG